MADEEEDRQPPDYGDEEAEGGMFRWMSTLVVLLAVAGFFGLAWYAYKNGGETVDEKDVELIKADSAPIKEAPANPGGMQIPNQDKTVYGLISGKTPKPVAEHILPAPEEPLPRSNDTKTWMSDSAKGKSDDETPDAAKPEAAAPKAPVTAPMQVAQVETPPAPKEQFNPSKALATESTGKTPVATPAPEIKEDTAPAKAAAVEEKKKPEIQSAVPGGTLVQLGAYKSQAEAESNWIKISKQFADVLEGKKHYIARADLGSKGVFYRLQLAPFVSSAEAEEFCVDFVSEGQGCFPAKGK